MINDGRVPNNTSASRGAKTSGAKFFNGFLSDTFFNVTAKDTSPEVLFEWCIKWKELNILYTVCCPLRQFWPSYNIRKLIQIFRDLHCFKRSLIKVFIFLRIKVEFPLIFLYHIPIYSLFFKYFKFIFKWI